MRWRVTHRGFVCSAESAQTVRTQNSMAGDERCEWISRHRLRCSAMGAGSSSCRREPCVCANFSRRNRQRRTPTRRVKRRILRQHLHDRCARDLPASGPCVNQFHDGSKVAVCRRGRFSLGLSSAIARPRQSTPHRDLDGRAEECLLVDRHSRGTIQSIGAVASAA